DPGRRAARGSQVRVVQQGQGRRSRAPASGGEDGTSEVTTFRLGINTCFAVKRWPRPSDWAAVVRDELGLDLVQHCLDLVDLEAGRADLESQAADLRDCSAAAGLALHSTFTGLAAYSANLLLHPDPRRRVRARGVLKLVIDFTSTAGAQSFGGDLRAD